MKFLPLVIISTIVQAFSIEVYHDLDPDSNILRRGIKRKGSPSRSDEPFQKKPTLFIPRPVLLKKKASSIADNRSPTRNVPDKTGNTRTFNEKDKTPSPQSKSRGQAIDHQDESNTQGTKNKPPQRISPGGSSSGSPKPDRSDSPKSVGIFLPPLRSPGEQSNFFDNFARWEPRNPTPADKLLPVGQKSRLTTTALASGAATPGAGYFEVHGGNGPGALPPSSKVLSGYQSSSTTDHRFAGIRFVPSTDSSNSLGTSVTAASGRHSVQLVVDTRNGGPSKVNVQRPGSPLRSFEVPKNVRWPMNFVNPRPDDGMIRIASKNSPGSMSYARGRQF